MTKHKITTQEVVQDGWEFTKENWQRFKEQQKAKNEPVQFTREEIQQARLPYPWEVYQNLDPKTSQMYKSKKYQGLKKAWQIWCTYIATGSYPFLRLIVERNKKKMLAEIDIKKYECRQEKT